ncbi:cation:proton antiporter [Micromonospora sp. WMMD1102]|uniref:cation:proton antiporter domain-containing protein n=1 Tax=Micromonospora sp. WMMD1102 TaxID=3016105 RepID=UPI0024157432|nr:cation:proton antiporter [Micromonospora sp. WMMD1102]MDG4785160.1 cation:proton antiporter [Micromonospora sp. WMMD1102]
MAALVWLGAILGAAFSGWATAALVGADGLDRSPTYQVVVLVLLAIGLFASASGISLPEARRNLSAIVFAVTVGVLLKAALIGLAAYHLIGPEYAVLGLVVAQIDPLAVAALGRRPGMSEQARTLLYAWSSFDDPITTLLTVYASGWLLGTAGIALDDAAPSPISYAGGILANLGFALGALVVWLLLVAASRATARWLRPRWRGPAEWVWLGTNLAVLAAMLAAAVHLVLMLGVALAGLFFRPRIEAVLRWVTSGALLAAAFALGLLLVPGIDLVSGALLAGFAFAAQMVAAAVLPAKLTRADRVYLALGQQNGITAIILALVLEPALPGTVAIVAPAILLINLLHFGANAWWELPRPARPGPLPDPVEAVVSPAVADASPEGLLGAPPARDRRTSPARHFDG